MTDSLDPTRYFGSLRAEGEADWLAQAYVPPRMVSQMTGSSSILVTGGDGLGKNALEFHLKAYAAQKESPRLLTAIWRPELPAESLTEEPSEAFIAQAMNSLSFAYLQMVVREPSLYADAPSWTRDFMHWFVRTYLRGDRDYHLDRLAEGAGENGIETVARLLSETPRDIFASTAQPPPLPSSVLSHLADAIKKSKLEGAWIFLDNLDTLHRLHPERMEKFLVKFFSTLDLFEEPVFSFKAVVSSELGERLQKTRGVLTGRFTVHPLRWQEGELIRIVENRLAATRDGLSLARLCKDGDLLEWMKRYADDSPRSWLTRTRPILAAYLEKGKPLTQDEWLDICRQSPPPLHLDLGTGRVFVGRHESPLTGVGYQLLRYLYENRRLCTKSELFYRVQRGLDHEPRSNGDTGWEDIKAWEGQLDTAIYRVRQVIEWDPREGAAPLYIISERGKGQIRLENVV